MRHDDNVNSDEVPGADVLAAELAVALELADLADGLTLPRFEARSFTVDWKTNATEVTEVDREAEASLVERLGQVRPAHSVYGEEHGAQGDGDSRWRWIIDPIDGTSGFARGIPVWGTLLALTYDHDVVVGVVSAPALGRRWWASAGGGAFADSRRCRVSTVDRLGDAQVSVALNDGWDDLGLTAALSRLQLDARRSRGVGDFWQHMLVAEGAMDVAVDAIGVEPYDVATVKLIVEEAGGIFTDRHGIATYESGSAISSNGLLHDDVLERLREPG